MRRTLGILVLLAPFALAAEAPGAFFEDGAWGYKVRVPQGWRAAAVKPGEAWIASKHLGKRPLEAIKAFAREEPEMWVVGFPHVRKEKGDNPYADYKDFAQRTEGFLSWADGRYEFTQEEETELDGVKVTMYEIRGTNPELAPRRVVAWCYRFDDIDFVVQFKVLEEHFDGFAATFKGCLKSFRRIDRTKALPGAAPASEPPPDLGALAPDERRRALEDAVERRLRTEIEALPTGWKSRKGDAWLALYNADEKFVKATLDHADAVRAHMEKLFGGSAGGSPPGILRIFATDAEREAFGRRETTSADVVREVLLASGRGYEKDNEFESLNRAMFRQWLHYRNPLAEGALPEWLAEGIDKYVGMLRTKAKRISFVNEDYDRDWMRLQIKKGEYAPIRGIFASTEWGGVEGPGTGEDKKRQTRCVVLWLMTDGNKGRYQNLVRDFLDAVVRAVDETEAALRAELAKPAPDAKDPPTPPSLLQLEGGVKGRRAEIAGKAFRARFGEWTDKDWDALQRAWLEYAK